MRCLWYLLAYCWFISGSLCFLQRCNPPQTWKPSNHSRGQPLILTPYIKEGRIREARRAALVRFLEVPRMTSYSGFFTVDERYNSNLFFWFFPAVTNYKTAPVLLWLEGGPGSSTMFDVFLGTGPLSIDSVGRLGLGQHPWTSELSVIYIDNPVGTGFSFTDGGFAQNQTVVGDALYSALLQFFQLFPELQTNKLFVGGISYAGKFVPAVSYAIHKNHPSAKLKLNLQGLAIGNGLTDPENQLDCSEYLYQVGLLDSRTKTKFRELELAATKHIRQNQWLEATGQFFKIWELFLSETGFDAQSNILVSNSTSQLIKMQAIADFLNQVRVKQLLHVGNVSFSGENMEVLENLMDDVMKSVAPWVAELLNHYRVLFYNGQLDLKVTYPATVRFLQRLKFSAADEYKIAQRYPWRVDSELAGYVKRAGNLTEVMVRNAGHMAQLDQPRWILDLITRFTHGTL